LNKIENKAKIIFDEEDSIPKEIVGDIKFHKPSKIKQARLINDNPIQLNCLIEWKKVDDIIPQESWVSGEILKKECPETLISYYESYIKLI
jgi:hypothetical protein